MRRDILPRAFTSTRNSKLTSPRIFMGVLACILGISMSSRLWAIPMLPLTDHGTSRVEVSKAHLNRIAIKDDRIKQVFGVDERLVVESDEDSGQLFVRFSDATTTRPHHITLMSEKGLTHDLTLVPTQKPATAILFKEVTAGSSSLQNASLQGQLQGQLQRPLEGHQSEIIALMQTMARGAAGDSYSRRALKKADRSYGQAITLTPKFCYSGPTYQGLVYEVVNTLAHTVQLYERDLALEGDLAVALSQVKIAPSQKAMLYIVQKAAPKVASKEASKEASKTSGSTL